MVWEAESVRTVSVSSDADFNSSSSLWKVVHRKKTVRRSVQVHVSQSNEENLQHRSSVVIVVSIATNGLQQSWRVMMIS